MLPFRQVFTPQGVFFYEADPYYHLRRILLTVQHFPRVPVFDSYMAYPDGANCFWPPLFDFFVACLAMLAGLGHPSQRLVETVAALVPPVLGALTAIPVFALARMVFDRKVAWISALVFALMPAHIAYSTVGRADHHVAEVLLFMLTSVSLLKALQPDCSSDFSRYWSIVAGVCMAGLFLVQTASTVYVGVLFLFTLINGAVRVKEGEGAAQAIRRSATAFMIAAVVLLPFCRLDATGPEAVMRLSWFHFGVLAGPAVLLAAWGMALRWRRGQRALLVGTMGVAAVALLAWPGVWSAVKGGASFLTRTDPWARMFVESRPLFRSIEGLPAGSFAEVQLTWGLYFVPIALALTFLSPRRRTPATLYFLIATMGVGILALMQQRFASPFSAYVSLCIGYLVALAPAGAQRLLRTAPSPWVSIALQALVLVLFYYPSLSYFTCLSRQHYEAADRFFSVPEEFYKAMKWMSAETPPTSHYDSPTARPEYGVLCEWDNGHWVEYLAHRPVVSNNFGTHLLRPGFLDSIRFLLARSEDEAMNIIQRYGVRYVITAPLLVNVQDYAAIIGRTGVTYVRRGISPNGERAMTLYPEYFSLMGVRLHEFDGRFFDTGTMKGPRLSHFRLVYEADPGPTPPGVIPQSPVKVFEVVRGARLSGRVAPSADVAAFTQIGTGVGRSFRYAAIAKADSRGDFEMILPYATGKTEGPVRTETDYTVASGGKCAVVRVPERAVLDGTTITAVLK